MSSLTFGIKRSIKIALIQRHIKKAGNAIKMSFGVFNICNHVYEHHADSRVCLMLICLSV
jgi:hypothetical protein